jgi:hypothetical protein
MRSFTHPGTHLRSVRAGEVSARGGGGARRSTARLPRVADFCLSNGSLGSSGGSGFWKTLSCGLGAAMML